VTKVNVADNGDVFSVQEKPKTGEADISTVIL